jgi:hypothetical protein
MGGQRGDKGRQAGITQPFVIRSPTREAVARPRPDRKTHVPRQVRKDTGLQIRGTRLRGQTPAQHRQCSQRHRQPEHSYQKPEDAALPTRIGPAPPFALRQTSGHRIDHGVASRFALGRWINAATAPSDPSTGQPRLVSGTYLLLLVRGAEFSFNERSAAADVRDHVDLALGLEGSRLPLSAAQLAPRRCCERETDDEGRGSPP